MDAFTGLMLIFWMILMLIGVDRVNKNLRKMTEEIKEVKFRIQK